MDNRPPESFLKRRVANVESSVKELGYDALIVLANTQKGYLSGFTTGVFIAPGGAMLITAAKDSPHVYVTGGTDYEECREALLPIGWQVEAYRYPLGQTVNTELARLVGELGLRKIAVEGKYITVSQLEALREELSPVGAELEIVGDVVDPFREVKDSWEIEQIRQANEVNRVAFEHILPMVRPGVSEWVLGAQLENQMRIHGRGTTRLAFHTHFVSGPRSSLPHGGITQRELEAGDFVTIDYGATWNGYCCDVTRTFVVGKATEKHRSIYQAVLDAQLAAIELMQVGKRRGECAEVAMALIKERGYGEYMAHGAGGHGIGLEVHEGPGSRGDEPWVSGNVMTMEPGIYLPGWGGVRIEDNIVITDDGPLNLTSIGKELLEL